MKGEEALFHCTLLHNIYIFLFIAYQLSFYEFETLYGHYPTTLLIGVDAKYLHFPEGISSWVKDKERSTKILWN